MHPIYEQFAYALLEIPIQHMEQRIFRYRPISIDAYSFEHVENSLLCRSEQEKPLTKYRKCFAEPTHSYMVQNTSDLDVSPCELQKFEDIHRQ